MRQTSLLLKRLVAAFLEGKSRRPASHVSPQCQLCELTADCISQRLPDHEWCFIFSCTSRQNLALESARRNELEKAERQSETVADDAERSCLSLQGHLLLQAFVQPAAAYLCYRRRDFSRARELLLSASAHSQTLVKHFGYALMSAHQLQISCNLVRINALLDGHEHAVRFGVQLLDYLESGVEQPLNHLVSHRYTLDAVPQPILEHYFDKICGEIASLVAGKRDWETDEIFRIVKHHADPHGCPHYHFGPRAHRWLQLKRFSLDGDIDGLLDNAISLLESGKGWDPSLWFCTIIEVVSACESLGSDAAQVADMLMSESLRQNDASWAIKEFGNSLADWQDRPFNAKPRRKVRKEKSKEMLCDGKPSGS